jgi:uncharacterized membrane protein YeaQ/YmgE (transglycosylase-associated protein family)
MSTIWYIVIGLIVGFMSCMVTSKNDLGKIGNILTCIIGALTGYFFIHSLNLSLAIGKLGNISVAASSSVFFLVVMRKISNSF